MTTPDITATEPPLAESHPNMANQALHVLTLAQRTANEHVHTAQRHADKIRADALAAAEQIAHDADAHAQNLRREAEKVLASARTAAEGAAREAQARVEEAQQNADRIVAEARRQAEAIVANAEHNTEELKQQAQRRYDDVVGSLATKRAALQEQIEALERFDREYRGRLTAFMQAQLRALWADQPQVAGEFDDLEMADDSVPTEQSHAEAPSTSVPGQRKSEKAATDSASAVSAN
ncbi:ATP synthase F0 subunit B [Planosporangium flavigriseum]|nr:ATP synthase F0 subunit B [Planosporangium flavigriseum]NJC66735.1 ATP synthase F0 subunit B [Planosporangium flavigriseum]